MNLIVLLLSENSEFFSQNQCCAGYKGSRLGAMTFTGNKEDNSEFKYRSTSGRIKAHLPT